MFNLQTADILITACTERAPRRNAEGEIVAQNVGLVLINPSRRSLGYELVKVSTALEGCSDTAVIAADETGGDIPAQSRLVIDCGLVLDRPLSDGTVLRGTLQAILRYGAAPRLDETIRLNAAFSFKALSPSEIAVFRWHEL